MSVLPPSVRPRRLATRLRQRLARADRVTAAAALVSLTAGVLTFAVAATVFSHHSANHDEGVYLTQAALLLGGQLEFHAGPLADAFHPWFFIEDGGRLYPKYNPVPAATFGVSMLLFGEPRVTLAAVAAGNAALVYLLGSLSFGRRAGLAAAVLFAASPMAIATTSTFLPYAPTTFFNLVFAVAYLRSVRDGSLPAAGLAGVTIGIAFFARPYTAVLFAAPFICHALWRVISATRRFGAESTRATPRALVVAGVRGLPDPVRRHGLTALLGTLFVAVTLAYNVRMTGSPLTFPYQAFAPMDGPGFGERRILGHSVEYTLGLALESNGYALAEIATRWLAGGSLGTALALAGGAVALRGWFASGDPSDLAAADGDGGGESAGSSTAPGSPRFRRTAALLLVGVAVAVVVGNLFFWGTHNALADLADPTDGLASLFGPFYHFDLLVPLSVFGGLAVAAGWRALASARERLVRRDVPPTVARVAVAVVVVSAVAVAGVAAVDAASEPIDRNAAVDAKHEAAYAPIDATDFEDGLVFLPTPYGEWQNHPFQYLRNGPGLDGDVVYALGRDPVEDFAVLDAYPDRTLYRYGYRGTWTPNPDVYVTPKLESLDRRSGSELAAETTVGVPDRVARAQVRVDPRRGGEGGPDHVSYTVTDPDDSLAVGWTVTPDGVRLPGAGGAAADAADGSAESVPFDPEGDVVAVTVTLVDPAGATYTYRQEVTVRVTEGGEAGEDGERVEAVWPPERSTCRLVTECGNEGTYLPDEPDTHPEWVVFETDAEAAEE
ncbi:ArnT family glycosyltransferase [Halorubrum cibi]|uniref:Dolichyl-phosphate-mannose-protein mannosyltransferase n=1 Tax=Halorubrum cibi TaxID=413815 RepID=A0A521AGW3_9EURY|nr:glycosyltransferase family 39 protein [Halorubrum cibi]SMO34054.1 Dolichyl-phosphate-mannose-protein mannosyltransferase [Halorubrum cibi]